MSTDTSSDERLTWTIAEAAQRLGIGRSVAYRAAHTGELPAVRIGGRLLVPRSAVEAMLAGALRDDQH